MILPSASGGAMWVTLRTASMIAWLGLGLGLGSGSGLGLGLGLGSGLGLDDRLVPRRLRVARVGDEVEAVGDLARFGVGVAVARRLGRSRQWVAHTVRR